MTRAWLSPGPVAIHGTMRETTSPSVANLGNPTGLSGVVADTLAGRRVTGHLDHVRLNQLFVYYGPRRLPAGGVCSKPLETIVIDPATLIWSRCRRVRTGWPSQFGCRSSCRHLDQCTVRVDRVLVYYGPQRFLMLRVPKRCRP